MPNDDRNPIWPTKKMKAVSEPQLRSTVRPQGESRPQPRASEASQDNQEEAPVAASQSGKSERPAYKPQPQRAAESQGEELRRQLREMEEERRVRRKKQKNFMGGDNFFAFDTFWSTTLVKIIYLVGFLLINGGFIVGIISTGFRSGPLQLPGVDPFYGGINDTAALLALGGTYVVAWILANVIWRLLCESLIVRFKTYETMRSIEEKLQMWEIERKSERSGN